MVDEKTLRETHVLKVGDKVFALDCPDQIPTIYHEFIVSMSHLNGIIEVVLATSSAIPNEVGVLERRIQVTAHLKSNISAAIALRNSLNDAILLAVPVENPEGPKN